MLDGNHRRHAVPYISTVKIGILILQDAKLPGIRVHYLGELGLKPGYVCTALGIIDAVTKAQHFFMKLINILKGNLNREPI